MQAPARVSSSSPCAGHLHGTSSLDIKLDKINENDVQLIATQSTSRAATKRERLEAFAAEASRRAPSVVCSDPHESLMRKKMARF